MKKKNKTSKYSLGIICSILFRNSHVIEGKNELNNKKTEWKLNVCSLKKIRCDNLKTSIEMVI